MMTTTTTLTTTLTPTTLTTTTSPPPLRPSRRGKVAWSQHTSYPGAAGVHSEVGAPTASCQRASAAGRQRQQQLQANLASLQSLHHKELRRLHRQRKALQASMLAYAHKMRDIASGKVLLTSSPASSSSSSCTSPSSGNSNSGGGRGGPGPSHSGGSSLQKQKSGRRVSHADKSRHSPPVHSSRDSYNNNSNNSDNNSGNNDEKGQTSPSARAESQHPRDGEARSRISVDSGVDVTEAWAEQPRRAAGGRQRISLPILNAPSSPTANPVSRPRPASFHATEKNRSSKQPPRHQKESRAAGRRPSSFHIADAPDFYEDSVTGTVFSRNVFSNPNRNRQRRSGTNESPTMLFQKFSRADHAQRDTDDPDNLGFLLSLPDAADIFPSISPFPEFSEESRTAEESDTTDILTARRNVAQIPSPHPLSPAKLKKTKEQYWSLKKTQIDRKSPARNSKNFGKFRGPPHSLSPRQSLRSSKKAKDKPLPTKVSFQRSFRYSEAVETLLKSFEDCKLEMIDQVRIRKAADFLPALDIQDLKEERSRLKQQKPNDPHTLTPGRKVSSHLFRDTQSHDVTKTDVKEATEENREDVESDDVRSDYDSIGGSDASSVSSDEEMRGPADVNSEEEEEEGESDREGGYSHMGRGSGDSGKVVSRVRKTGHVSFCLPPLRKN